MEIGIPCNFTTSLQNDSTTLLAVYGCLSGMKCEYLDNLSTTTRIASYPFAFGRPVIKSMEISSHI
jgi:hypothetical protein